MESVDKASQAGAVQEQISGANGSALPTNVSCMGTGMDVTCSVDGADASLDAETRSAGADNPFRIQILCCNKFSISSWSQKACVLELMA